jgi:hypothetical protein
MKHPFTLYVQAVNLDVPRHEALIHAGTHELGELEERTLPELKVLASVNRALCDAGQAVTPDADSPVRFRLVAVDALGLLSCDQQFDFDPRDHSDEATEAQARQLADENRRFVRHLNDDVETHADPRRDLDEVDKAIAEVENLIAGASTN